MTDNVENLVLEHLRALRNEVQTFRADLLAETSELKHRLSAIEIAVLSVRRDTVATDTELARHQAVLDRFAERIERIERRLEPLPYTHLCKSLIFMEGRLFRPATKSMGYRLVCKGMG